MSSSTVSVLGFTDKDTYSTVDSAQRDQVIQLPDFSNYFFKESFKGKSMYVVLGTSVNQPGGMTHTICEFNGQ